MADFATVSDLESFWRPLSTEEKAQAVFYLAAGSAMLRAKVPGLDDKIAAGDVSDELVKFLLLQMVRRAMMSADDGVGVVQEQHTAGPFNYQRSFSNPQGNLYVSKSELSLLGVGVQRAFTVDTTPVQDDS